MLLDACTAFCATLQDTFGATVVELATIVLGFVLVWWRGKKQLAQVAAKADSAHTELASANQKIARLEGSLRPAAPINVTPVRITGPGASMPDPGMLSGETSLPPPAPVPDDDERTPSERPSAKGG